MDPRIKSVLKRSNVKCSYVSETEDQVILGVRETRSTGIKLYKNLKSIGLTPVNTTFGRWVCRIEDKYEEDRYDD